MNSIRTLLIILVTLFAFSNCDFFNQDEKDDTIEDLTYELTSSWMAVDVDEDRRQMNDERVKGKFLCQKACSGEIPDGYDECFDKFKQCKESGQKKCGKVFRQCTSQTNVTVEDWNAFKTCKKECRDTVAICKVPFRECKSNCSGDIACLEGCIHEQMSCFEDEVCDTYQIFCEETGCLRE